MVTLRAVRASPTGARARFAVLGLTILAAGLFTADGAYAQVTVRLGKVQGPAWSRVRAAIQVVLKGRDEVDLVRSGKAARVGGRIRKGGRGYLADLVLVDDSGAKVGQARFSGVDGRALAGDIKERLWSQLGPEILALDGGAEAIDDLPAGEAPAPPPPPKTTAVPAAPRKAVAAERSRAVRPTDAPKSSARSTARSSRAPSSDGERTWSGEALRFSVGVGIFARELSWVDDLFNQLAGYSLGAAPAFRLGAEWYPGAHFASGPAGWIGLDVEAELPFGVESNRQDVTFPTAASAWRLGVIGRLPVDAFEFGLGVGFAERRFAIEVSDEGLAIPDLPAVRYQTLSTRLTVSARILEMVDVSARGGWGFMLDAGAIGRGTWFPRSASHTASLGGTLGVHIAKGLGIFGRFDWQGAFFDLLPEPGDARVAGGASDQFYLGTVGISYATGG